MQVKREQILLKHENPSWRAGVEMGVHDLQVFIEIFASLSPTGPPKEIMGKGKTFPRHVDLLHCLVRLKDVSFLGSKLGFSTPN